MSYLVFTQTPKPTRKTLVFAVTNTKGEKLGQIFFNPRWRRYVFEPWYQPIFDSGCLVEIVTKIDTLMQERLGQQRVKRLNTEPGTVPSRDEVYRNLKKNSERLKAGL